jgi:threonine synthase
MRFHSTRQGSGPGVTASEAIWQGLAGDGGLYVPEKVPALELSSFDACDTEADVAVRVLAPFFYGDPLEEHLADICREALNFPMPVVPLPGAPAPAVLELFHGPTCAFKDVGARFLAGCLARLQQQSGRTTTILVATSGDTGGAVAAAFHGRPGFRVVVLYPEGLVSPRQAHQLSCWGGNVTTYSVSGTFDDCQRLVKAAFADDELSQRLGLNSANSINLGRLLPQMTYYATTALAYRRRDLGAPGFVIPTGNLGNGCACLMARAMGLPIGDVILATNANRTIPDYLSTGEWRPRPSLATLASAMDVGDPSNIERLRWLFPGLETLRDAASAVWVSDDEIRETIRGGVDRWQQAWCPHTATAMHAWESMRPAEQERPWVVVATAHPAKFDTVVEPLVGGPITVPDSLATLLAKPAVARSLKPDLASFRAALAQLPPAAA